MSEKQGQFHPYVPNTVPEVRQEMLSEIGVDSIRELYGTIPDDLIYDRELDIPDPICSEFELKRHVKEIISENETCDDYLNFLGGGTWQHYVPAICDEINGRSEFLTAYAGEPYEDHGRFQAAFEASSMLGELVDMDVVSVPTYDWSQSAGTALSMASRMTDRGRVLIPDNMSPDRASVIENYCSPGIEVKRVGYEPATGRLNLEDLESQLSPEVAAVYFENPSYLGFIEDKGEDISRLAHDQGALSVVGVDPSSLGVLSPPPDYGADIVCGELQPLGIHMNFGGGLSGFVATPDEEEYVMEYPLRLFGITSTEVEGEYGFGDVAYERTSFAKRESGKEFVGTMTALWGITAGVYLALMGPEGMKQLGQTILQRSKYAQEEINKIPGVKAPGLSSAHFKEFIVDFNGTDRTVEEINKELLDREIFGGKDLSSEFPKLGQSALLSITEVHSQQDIDSLVTALDEVVRDGC
ncbi:MAG: aminomethyl-transferring glycine dehydrogenase subunit GcvPA [Candidatus Bipolaricaulota bacterium]